MLDTYVAKFDEKLGTDCFPCPTDLIPDKRSSLITSLEKLPDTRFKDLASSILVDRSVSELRGIGLDQQREEFKAIMEQAQKEMTNDKLMNVIFSDYPQLTEVMKENVRAEIRVEFPDNKKICCPVKVTNANKRQLGESTDPKGVLSWKSGNN